MSDIIELECLCPSSIFQVLGRIYSFIPHLLEEMTFHKEAKTIHMPIYVLDSLSFLKGSLKKQKY